MSKWSYHFRPAPIFFNFRQVIFVFFLCGFGLFAFGTGLGFGVGVIVVVTGGEVQLRVFGPLVAHLPSLLIVAETSPTKFGGTTARVKGGAPSGTATTSGPYCPAPTVLWIVASTLVPGSIPVTVY